MFIVPGSGHSFYPVFLPKRGITLEWFIISEGNLHVFTLYICFLHFIYLYLLGKILASFPPSLPTLLQCITVLWLQKSSSELPKSSSLVKHNIAFSLPFLGVTRYCYKETYTARKYSYYQSLSPSVSVTQSNSLGYVSFVAYVTYRMFLPHQNLIYCFYCSTFCIHLRKCGLSMSCNWTKVAASTNLLFPLHPFILFVQFPFLCTLLAPFSW